MTEKKSLLDRFFESPKWLGIAGIATVLALLIALWVAGLLDDLLDELQKGVTIQLWFFLLMGVLALVAVAMLIARFRRKQAKEDKPVRLAGAVSSVDVPEYHDARGLLWPWPRPDRGSWQGICPKHHLPVTTAWDVGETENQKLIFTCPGPVEDGPHIIEGPTRESLGGIPLQTDVENRITADIIADSRYPPDTDSYR